MLTTCRRSCCWNPFGPCGKKRKCRCHPQATPPADTPQAELDHVDQLNNNRNPHIE